MNAGLIAALVPLFLLAGVPVVAAAQSAAPEPAAAGVVPAPEPRAPAPDLAGAATVPAAEPRDPAAAEAERRRLEEELARELGGSPAAAPPPVPAAGPIASAGSLKLIDIAVDLLPVAGWSSRPEEELRLLEAGGHDPKNRGFTLQNLELTFAGIVDPYLRGNVHVILQIDEDGESVVELEEAYLTTLALPYGLELKGGQFFTGFGRLNAQHPHAWDFADQPIVNGRFFGPDGLRNPGLQLSWLTPLPFFAELLGSVQNAQGETAVSFRSAPGEELAGRTLGERPVGEPGDLLYLTRLKSSFDAGDTVTFVPGISALFGPNSSGDAARTEVYGADLYVKWKPLEAEGGWPFLTWQSEAMLRRYHAGPGTAPGPGTPAEERLDDRGIYTQLLWGFTRHWIVGARVERATAEPSGFVGADGTPHDEAADPVRGARSRLSGVLSYFPSEFSKLRLQYNLDRAAFLPEDAHAVFLQAEILFGAHGAHRF